MVPTVVLPKFSAVGASVSWPSAALVADSATSKLEFDAFETAVMPPVALRAPGAGTNSAVKVTLAPGKRVNGRVSPLTLNPDPVTATCEMVTLVPPVLVKVSGRLMLEPDCTLPKDRLAGLAVS